MCKLQHFTAAICQNWRKKKPILERNVFKRNIDTMQNLSLQTRNISATAFPPLLFRGIRLTLFLKIYVYYEYHICDILRVWLRFMLLFTFFFDFPFCT